MKVTVEIPNSQLKEICFFTGESKKGPAIRKMVTDALMMKRRQRLARRFISGQSGVDLRDFEAGQSKDHGAARQRSRLWRD